MSKNKTNFVSCDTSTTHSGMALFINGQLKDYIVLKPKNKELEPRMYEMAQLMYKQLNKWKPEVLYLETPQGHGANVKLARNLGEMLGVVMGWCAGNNCYFEEVAPSTWRSWCEWDFGKLSRPELKKMSIKKLKEETGIETKSDDLADAINLGLGVLKHYNSENLFEE